MQVSRAVPQLLWECNVAGNSTLQEYWMACIVREQVNNRLRYLNRILQDVHSKIEVENELERV